MAKVRINFVAQDILNAYRHDPDLSTPIEDPASALSIAPKRQEQYVGKISSSLLGDLLAADVLREEPSDTKTKWYSATGKASAANISEAFNDIVMGLKAETPRTPIKVTDLPEYMQPAKLKVYRHDLAHDTFTELVESTDLLVVKDDAYVLRTGGRQDWAWLRDHKPGRSLFYGESSAQKWVL